MLKKSTYEELERKVNELEKATDEFPASDQRKEAILNSLKEHVIHQDTEMRILWANRAACESVNLSYEEIVGRYCYKIWARRNDPCPDCPVVRAIETGQPQAIEKYTPDERYWFIRGYPFRDKNGDIVGGIEITLEITEQKQAEETIRESERRYSALVQESPDAIISLDKTGNFLSFNTVAERISGFSAEEVMGKHFTKIGVLAKESIPKALKEFALVITGIERPPFELTIMRKDKSYLFMEANPRLIKNKEEKAWIQVTLRDITDRKLVEKEKKKLEAQLQQAHKMETIGTLAGGIAHDFNNILYSIIGYTELALDDTEKRTHLHDNLQEVLIAAKRAKDLVKQILTFSRQVDREPKPLKIQIVVQEALKLIRSSLPSTIEINRDIDNSCRLVMADATQIHQVVMNLLTNAYHAMEDQGGKLDVTLKEVDLDLDDLQDLTMPTGPYVCLTVADTGTGIDKYVMDRIFEPYFSTKKKDKGTGLGLAMVHGIVKSYGGKIKVYSEPGKGSSFHVYLPVIQTQGEKKETQLVLPVEGGTERILLVDDELQIVRMEQQMLERLGYHVTVRTSSIEALEAFRSAPDKFDLIITDMTMPNMTGVELAKKIIEIKPDIPIIICTGFSEKISEHTANTMGIRGYVMKPVIKSELAKKIKEVLDQK
ncbi:MAG: PAS domain S-box protein [Desulfobacterales bacterium]|jgi:PAS domain S-box-containing protein